MVCFLHLFLVSMSQTRLTSTVVRDFNCIHFEFRHSRQPVQISFYSKKIIYFTTTTAIKMRMFRCISIIPGILFVNGQHLYSPFFDEQIQGIVNSCFRKRRDFRIQGNEYFINSRVCRMIHQVTHHCRSLNRRSDFKFNQMSVYIAKSFHFVSGKNFMDAKILIFPFNYESTLISLSTSLVALTAAALFANKAISASSSL